MSVSHRGEGPAGMQARRQWDSEGHLPLAEWQITNPSHLGGDPELKGDSPSPA